MSSRHRPLHTCAVSFLAIVHSAYTKAQEFNGPIGSTTRRVDKLATFASPLVYAMQYQCKLTHWGSENTHEKEIIVDINCDWHNNEQDFVDEAQKPEESQANVDSDNKGSFPLVSETPQAETETVGKTDDSGVTKGTYKEVLEKGTKENMENKAEEENIEKIEKNEKTNVDKEEAEKGVEKIEDESDQIIQNDNPILELFESGWLG
uniref:Uncharacterized protein n=1 Tax=Fagus sylvatica TaxID=28930 RepID=A0A2N9H7Z7_FAGSY